MYFLLYSNIKKNYGNNPHRTLYTVVFTEPTTNSKKKSEMNKFNKKKNNINKNTTSKHYTNILKNNIIIYICAWKFYLMN